MGVELTPAETAIQNENVAPEAPNGQPLVPRCLVIVSVLPYCHDQLQRGTYGRGVTLNIFGRARAPPMLG